MYLINIILIKFDFIMIIDIYYLQLEIYFNIIAI